MNREKGPLSVSQLNDYLKMLLDGDRVLSDLFVRGEISNLTLARSGHIYFTLKDESGQIKVVMFCSYASRLRIRLADGMRVIVHGHVSLYGPSGQYQLYADELQPDGVGTLALQFEQLKRKLAAEGLFDAERKKPIPQIPSRVGIITSPTGAAIRDMIRISGRRFPAAEILLYPALVQGGEAAAELTLGIQFFDMTHLVDVIIIGRGGGSAEDLWAFNDEELARAIADCSIPVISAVGHESDFTICDFVADLRAATPSAAAELAFPDGDAIRGWLAESRERLQTAALKKTGSERRVLDALTQSRVFRHPEQMTEQARMRLLRAEEALERDVAQQQTGARERLARQCARLEALNPLSVLARGYATVSRGEELITRADSVACGDELQIRFADGVITAAATDGRDH